MLVTGSVDSGGILIKPTGLTWGSNVYNHTELDAFRPLRDQNAVRHIWQRELSCLSLNYISECYILFGTFEILVIRGEGKLWKCLTRTFLLNLDFTLLAVDMPNTAPSDLQPQPVISIIQLFGWDDIIWPQVVARYLSHLLQNRYVPFLFQAYSLVHTLILQYPGRIFLMKTNLYYISSIW